MKAWRHSLAAVALTASSGTFTGPVLRPRPEPLEFHFQGVDPARSGGRASVGVGIGLSEGKPLEVLLWGSGAAVVGSLAGPAGALIGGAVGALSGLVVAQFIVPKNGPETKTH